MGADRSPPPSSARRASCSPDRAICFSIPAFLLISPTAFLLSIISVTTVLLTVVSFGFLFFVLSVYFSVCLSFSLSFFFFHFCLAFSLAISLLLLPPPRPPPPPPPSLSFILRRLSTLTFSLLFSVHLLFFFCPTVYSLSKAVNFCLLIRSAVVSVFRTLFIFLFLLLFSFLLFSFTERHFYSVFFHF